MAKSPKVPANNSPYLTSEVDFVHQGHSPRYPCHHISWLRYGGWARCLARLQSCCLDYSYTSSRSCCVLSDALERAAWLSTLQAVVFGGVFAFALLFLVPVPGMM